MANFWKQRRERNRLKFSAMGKESQRVQAARRMAEMSDRAREQAEIESLNYPRREGDAMWGIRITNYATGKVWKWTLRIGKRKNQVTMHAASGKATGSVSMTWIMAHLRGYLAGTK